MNGYRHHVVPNARDKVNAGPTGYRNDQRGLCDAVESLLQRRHLRRRCEGPKTHFENVEGYRIGRLSKREKQVASYGLFQEGTDLAIDDLAERRLCSTQQD